jgi:ferredoxin--NADP+ reductase
LTVVEAEPVTGILTIIFQEVGLTTKLLGSMEPGQSVFSAVGPLGVATEIRNYGTVVIVGGGVGIAEIYPVVKAMKNAGNKVVTILGARTKELLLLEEGLRKFSDTMMIATDDGSSGTKGYNTGLLSDFLRSDKADIVYAVGPIPMMRKVSEITKTSGVKTLVSLNSLMVDGTGMCGCCRVTVAGKVKFSCIDGPEFDAHELNWAEIKNRSRVYQCQEKHVCNLEKLC